MAPNYRNPNRRQNRTGYVDHDVLEGLPVRQWRRDYTTIVPPLLQESTSPNDIWAVELPHGMPKDSHLLPQHSQDLLRAARSGRVYKRPTPVEEEEVDIEGITADKVEKKDYELKGKGYTVKAWKPVPRHLEGPAIDYLAKRRKGLVTVDAKTASTGSVLTKATVKRYDAAGNEYVQDVVVPHGETVEGEVISQTTIVDPNATRLGDGLLTRTPPRRKGPPKRKAKGPGRGRRRKPIVATSAPQTLQTDGDAQNVEGGDGVVETNEGNIKIENEGNSISANNEDTEMADGSAHGSDEEEGEEGEEEDDDEEEGTANSEKSPSKRRRSNSSSQQDTPAVVDVPSFADPNADIGGTEATAHPPKLHINREKLAVKSGSPLRNVALTTSSLNSPLLSPSASPNTTAANPSSNPAPKQEESSDTETVEQAILNKTMQEEAAATAPTALPPVPPEPTLSEEIASKEVLREEEEEEEMLLDIMENANNANIGGEEGSAPVPENPITPFQELSSPPSDEITSNAADAVTEPEGVLSAPSSDEITSNVAEVVTEQEEVQTKDQKEELAPTPSEIVEEEEQLGGLQPDKEEEDAFPDLLGGLEKQLNEPITKTPEHIAEPTPEAVEKAASSGQPIENTAHNEKAEETVEERVEEGVDGT